MSTNINSTEQIVEINAGDQITNINLVSQSTTQIISAEQVVNIDTNAGTIPAAWGSITGTLSNQTDLQNALNLKQNNITLSTTGTTGVATLVGATLNIPNYVTSTKQTEWDSAYNDKITSAEVSGTTTKTLTLNQQDGGTITASWSDFDTAPVTSVFGRTGDVVATEGDYNIGQMGDVTITSASNGQVLKYNGTAWVNAADASGLTSVGLAMPSAFAVSGSPLTSNGTITVTGAGTTSQYVRGDGSLANFPSTSNEAKTLIREVYNSTGATLTKGTVVYINGGQGNLPTVTKALAVGDVTSAQTFGIVQSDITNNNNGFVVVAGGIDNIDTQAFTEGTAIYLSPTTAGAWTSIKPYAPDHIVYLGVIVRSHPTQGVIEVKIQNGYELDELHNVSARFPSNKDGIFYNSTTEVWENKSIAGVLGYTPVPETRIITINGTAQNLSADRTYNVGTVTNLAASGGTGISIGGSPVTGSGTITITNTAPDQVVSLTGAGTTTTSGTYPNFTITSNDQYVGTVTSVNAIVPTGFEVSGVPITSSGTVDIKFASGYSLPTTAKQGQWDDAYAKRIDSLTVTGNSGSSTLTSNVLNVPTYTLAGLGGEPAITAGTTLQYFRGDKTFQTLDTSVVPENGAIYFTEPRVRATVLSGMNITGGAITASDNILNAFGKVQNQINGLIGGSIFQSTWNASTNTPSLASGVGTKGYYYIVSTAGTTNLDGITDWQIGDWAIFDGTVWRKVDNTDAVVSVNGYTGIVSLVLDDLADVSAASPTNAQLLRFNGTSSLWENWTPTFEPVLTKGNLTEATSSVLTITGGTGAVIGSGTTIAVAQASGSTSGYLSSTDWTTFNGKQTALNGTGFVKISGTTISYDNSTYLTTSSASSTYIPYSGATTNVDLGFNNLDANQINGFQLLAKLNGTGSSPLILKTGTSGYSYGNDAINLISSPTSSNTLTIISDVSSVLKIAEFSLGSLTATRTYTLPDASGTLALTSNLSSYLALTGGTLTGALSGTSATFSGNVTASGNAATTASYYANNNSGSSGTAQYYMDFGNGAGFTSGRILRGNGASGLVANGLNIDVYDGFGIRLNQLGGSGGTFAVTGGAATFSSSVTATQGNFTATANTYAGGSIILKAFGGTNPIYLTSVGGLFAISNGGSADHLLLNASGNLGLGVSPSAWGTDSKALQLTNYGSINGNTTTGILSLASNAYESSNNNWNRVNATSAGLYQVSYTGSHIWYNTIASTGGSAISWTQAMTLNASGNLSVGNNNDTYKLDVSGTGRFSGMLTISGVAEYLRSIQSGTSSQAQTWYAADGTTRRAVFGFRSAGSDNFTLLNEKNGSLLIGTNDATNLTIASTGAATFSADVNTAGKFKGRTSGSGVAFETTNAVDADFTIETVAGGTTKIGTSGNKLAINSGGGNVGINTVDPQDKLEIKSGYLRMFDPSSGLNAGYLIQWSSNNGGTNVTYAGIDGITTSAGNRTGDLRFLTSNAGAPAERMRITSGGAIEATSSIKTGAPSGGTAKPWKFGARVADTNLYLNSSQYIELDVDGTLYKLATIVKL